MNGKNESSGHKRNVRLSDKQKRWLLIMMVICAIISIVLTEIIRRNILS